MADPLAPSTAGITHDSAISNPVTLHAHGEFDTDTCDQILTAVRAALDAGRRTITMDLRHVTFIDAATVRTLLTCRALTADAGGTMQIINAVGLVAKVLDLIATQDDLRAPSADSRTPTPKDRKRPHPAYSTPADVIEKSALLIDQARTLMAETHRIRTMLLVEGKLGRTA